MGARLVMAAVENIIASQQDKSMKSLSKVKQALCKICKSAGQRICHDCVGEIYCDRCFKLVHHVGDLASHSQYDLIK